MMIGALSGARIDAIASLKVCDCKNGAFTFKRQKEPRDRTIPIHSQLTGIVARRVKGKGPAEFLFHEMPIATSTRPRSAAASQAFTRYRRKMKIGADVGEQSPTTSIRSAAGSPGRLSKLGNHRTLSTSCRPPTTGRNAGEILGGAKWRR